MKPQRSRMGFPGSLGQLGDASSRQPGKQYSDPGDSLGKSTLVSHTFRRHNTRWSCCRTRSTPDLDYHVVLILSGHSHSARHRPGNPSTTTNPQAGSRPSAPAKQRGNQQRVTSRAAAGSGPIAGKAREEPCMQDQPTRMLWLQWSRIFGAEPADCQDRVITRFLESPTTPYR